MQFLAHISWLTLDTLVKVNEMLGKLLVTCGTVGLVFYFYKLWSNRK